MDETPIQILALGASTAIGRNAEACAAAVRAGICGFSLHPFMVDTTGEPMRIARAPWIDVRAQGIERYWELLHPALDESIRSLAVAFDRGAANISRLALALALPASRPGKPDGLFDALRQRIEARHGGTFERITPFEAGHAAGHLALDAAIHDLGRNTLDASVIAGVDSYLSADALEWIEACDQLHGGGPLNNAWGFVPGEGAGAMVVARGSPELLPRANVLGEVMSVGVGVESKLIKSEDVCIGEGLSHALRSAYRALAPGEMIDNVFCDMNGEPYRADEYAFCALRVKERMRAATDFVAPADCWGDVGAAGMPLHVQLAAISCRKGYAKGPLSAVWASSETGERGAAVIRCIARVRS